MSPAGFVPTAARSFGPSVPILAAAVLVVAYGCGLATGEALLLAVLGVATAVGMRSLRHPLLAEVAPLPALVVLGAFAAVTPIAPLPELLVGVAGIAFVVWLVDDPLRPSAGIIRGAGVWGVPALGVGIAWASTFLLPPSAASLGVAGGLLAGGLILLAYLVGRPEMFDREQASTI